jgi:predicted nucleic acid binding AN1-type Zn finger protein
MKCFNCKKRTHLEFTCQCKNVLCVSCLLPEVHKCPIDLKTKVVLEKVVAEKVSKI